MKHLILRLEPLIWFLFGGGFIVGCLLFPAYLFATGIAAPLGWLPTGALSYDRVAAIVASPLGRLVALVMIVFPLWNGLNHLRHFAIDLFGAKRDAWIAPLCYATAALFSAAALVAVIRL